jgi:hypothetical protein
MVVCAFFQENASVLFEYTPHHCAHSRLFWGLHQMKMTSGLVGLVLFVLPVWAHHATAAQYDVSTTITLKGTISRIDWTNPHIHVYVDIKTENGNSVSWIVEFPSPGAIIVAGLSRPMLVPGTALTLEAYPSKPPADHSKAQRTACAKAITFPDGNRFAFVVGI